MEKKEAMLVHVSKGLEEMEGGLISVFELSRRKMASKFHYVPMFGCHKQSGLKCTGYMPLTASGGATIHSVYG